MLIIHHRRNTIEELLESDRQFGIEIDIRNHDDRLIVTHDPFQTNGVDFEDWLANYGHKFLIVNFKEEGLEPRVVPLLERFGVKDFFILDESFPYIRKYALDGLPNFAIRVSEYESATTPVRLATELRDKNLAVHWIWADSFTGRPLSAADAVELRRANYKICYVSPELHHVADPDTWEERIAAFQKELSLDPSGAVLPDMVCTKLPEKWMNFKTT